jgi:type IV secretory pathway VirB4 component
MNLGQLLRGDSGHIRERNAAIGRAAGHGGRLRVPAHRATTAHLAGAYPFVAEGGLGHAGVYIGRDLFGGAFVFDPWELYRQRQITNPNLLVIGQLGVAKSSLVKTLLWRSQTFGRAAVVADPKGEYTELAHACGVEPVRIGPGLPARLNPLDPGPAAGSIAPEELARRRLDLLATLLAASLTRPLRPVEHAALGLALTETTRATDGRPTLPDVVAALLGPTEAAANALRLTVAELAIDSRDAALELRRLCEGDLRGMFDGPTTVRPDFDAPLVVLDLSAIYGTAAMPLLMICATTWLHAALTAPGQYRYVLIDEAWALLQTVSTARWLQASYKLCRQYGVANIAAIHRLSDLSAAGADGTEQRELAKGLLADAETRVIYRQAPGEIAAARELLGLTDTEAAIIPTLPAGVALWRVGGRSFVVEHRRAPGLEMTITDTDARMVSDGITGRVA